MALQTGVINFSQEDYGTYILFGLPQGETTLADLVKEMDEEIVKIQTDLISEKSYQKLQNKFENNFVNANSNVEGIASSLARYNVLFGDTNLINTEINIFRSITTGAELSWCKITCIPLSKSYSSNSTFCAFAENATSIAETRDKILFFIDFYLINN